MRHRLIAVFVVIAGVSWLSGEAADAGDWMFRRSYYSHNTGPAATDDAAPSRTAYREPWAGAHPRFAIRGGWRFNTYVIQNGTNSTDRTFFRENWYDVNY